MGALKVMQYMVIAILLLAGFAGAVFALAGYSYSVDEAQLQEKINAKLPFSKLYYRIFTATLDEVALELIDGKVYIRCNVNLDSMNPLSFLQKSQALARIPLLSGQADMIATPVYHSDAGEVFLSNIKITDINIKGQRQYDDRFKQAIQKLSRAYFKKHPIYTLHKHKIKKQLAKYFLKSIEIKDHKLMLALHI